MKINLLFPGATGCPWRPCVPLISEQWLLLDLTFLCRNLLWSCKKGIRMSGSFLDAETDTWSQCSRSLWPQASRCCFCTVQKREQRPLLESWQRCHRNKAHLLRTFCALHCAKVICIEFFFLDYRNKQTHTYITYAHILFFLPVCSLNNPHRSMKANAAGHTLLEFDLPENVCSALVRVLQRDRANRIVNDMYNYISICQYINSIICILYISTSQ